ncbi:MAG TPA: right-handed parallel beta-helix repeat-containing protein [Candidatus Methylomirabilis sp.]|nr:right-handed parallel beta-helix repeat-containing protein [Candidatus Methylomirabilis sp.]
MIYGGHVDLRTFIAALSLAVLLGSAPASAAEGQDVLIQTVHPGQSIQAAVDRAASNGWIFILPGVYHETADTTNGLTISAPVHLVGVSTSKSRVVLENAGSQHNGIVVVPAARAACMSCHTSLAPPFPLLPGVDAVSSPARGPMIAGFSISGITIRAFNNNGLFTEHVDGFSIVDVESVDNQNYGIFPTQSKDGVISHSRATGSGDTGIWVETSQNVLVSDSLVENNVVGFEVSNSDNILFEHNESRNNTVGVGMFLLPGLFATHAGSERITIQNNSIHDNNRVNDAPPNTILGFLPSGTGVLAFGVDYSHITSNDIANNNTTGIAVVDVCVAFAGTSFDCSTDPDATPQFLADQDATNNSIARNVLHHNGTNPPPGPFAFAAGDLSLLSFGSGNCFNGNVYTTSFSISGSLPTCR